MTTGDQRFGAWCGVAFLVFFGTGFVLAGFIPPPPATLTADEVVAMYQAKSWRMKSFVVLAMTAIVFYPLFIGAISAQMLRMRGISRMATYVQLAAGVSGILMLLIPVMVLGVAAFRPDRDPQSLMALNDVVWLFFMTPFSTFSCQCIAIAIGVLNDKSPRPVFPRWVAYMNIWVALIAFSGVFAFFFHEGPFSWNGIFPFWLGTTNFAVWLLCMIVIILTSVREEEAATIATG